MTKRQNNKDNEEKPNRKILNGRHVEPKWFVYEASNNMDTKFSAKFIPLEEVEMKTPQYLTKQSNCLSMFVKILTVNLGFLLNPAIHKRFQEKVFVGSIGVDYFCTYFGKTLNHTTGKRIQYLSFNGKKITCHCPSYTFDGLESMPGLGCDRSYASTQWNVKTYQKIHNKRNNTFYFVEKIDYYRIMFAHLEFYCNPVTNLVFVNSEIIKQHYNSETREWEQI